MSDFHKDAFKKTQIKPNYENSRQKPNTEQNSSPVAYPFNNIDAGIIMEGMKFYLNGPSLAQLRLVSRGFARIVGAYEPIRNQVLYHVNGSAFQYQLDKIRNASVPTPIQVLLRSSFRWTHFKFSNMDVEEDFFSKEPLFNRFVKKFCLKYLKSLSLENVYFGMGRLIELVSFCPHLEELKIVDCPSLFTAGGELINWVKFIPTFHQRISQLKHFSVIDRRTNDSVLTLGMAQGWMTHMRSLISLTLESFGGRSFPLDFIASIIKLNVPTLRHLSLIGNSGMDDLTLDILSQLNLLSLRLGRFSQIQGGHIQIGTLLQTQQGLESLHLLRMTCPRSSLVIMGGLERLKKLNLEDVALVGDLGDPSQFPLAKLRALTDLRLTDTINTFGALQWMPIFVHGGTFHLTTLVLNFNYANALVNQFPKPFLDHLRVLVIMEMGRMEGIENDQFSLVTGKILDLHTLEKLEIINTKLTDSHFRNPTASWIMDSPFQKLRCLRMLNLSNTYVGNLTLITQIIRIDTLEALHLNKTHITSKGVQKFGSLRRMDIRGGPIIRLCKLQHLVARKCPYLRLTVENMKSFTDLLGFVILCDMKPDKGS